MCLSNPALPGMKRKRLVQVMRSQLWKKKQMPNAPPDMMKACYWRWAKADCSIRKREVGDESKIVVRLFLAVVSFEAAEVEIKSEWCSLIISWKV